MSDGCTVDDVGGSGGEANDTVHDPAMIPAAPAGTAGKGEVTDTLAGLGDGPAGDAFEYHPLVEAVRVRNEETFSVTLNDLDVAADPDAGIVVVLRALCEAITRYHTDFSVELMRVAHGYTSERDRKGVDVYEIILYLFCYSASRGRLNIVKAFVAVWPALLSARCSVNGKTGLDYANEHGHDCVAVYLRSLGVEPAVSVSSETAEDTGAGVGSSCDVPDEEVTVERPEGALTATVIAAHRTGSSVGGASDDSDTAVRCTGCGTTVPTAPNIGTLDGAQLDSTLLTNVGSCIAFSEILLLKELGRGASGVVWLAFYRLRLVACKMEANRPCSSEAEATAPRRSAFAAEARILSALQVPTHRNTLGFWGVGVDDTGGAVLVIEYAGSRTLKAALDASQIQDPVQQLVLCADLASGLAYTHGCSIVHGDIKPENIIVTDGGELDVCGILIDFGSSRRHWRGAAAYTPLYAAPEVLEGGLTETRSDVFSLACVLYRVLTGRPLSSGRAKNWTLHPVADDGSGEIGATVEQHLAPQHQGQGIGRLLARCWEYEARNRPTSRAVRSKLLTLLEVLAPEKAAIIAAANERHPIDTSSLTEAVLDGDINQVNDLLQAGGCRVDEQNRHGHTALHAAAALSDTAMLRALTRDNPRVLEDNSGTTATDIAKAISMKDPSEEAQLAPGILRALEIDNKKALAKSRNSAETADTASASDRRRSNRAVLHGPAAAGDEGRVQSLLRQGASPLWKDEFGVCALRHAVSSGSPDIVDIFLTRMLEAGEQVDWKIEDWCDLLTFAFDNGTPATLERVLSRLPENDSVLGVATELFRTACVEKSPEWVAVLASSPKLARGSWIDYYIAACRAKRWDILRVLVEPNAARAFPASTQTPESVLVNACAAGIKAVVEFLLALGTDVNVVAGEAEVTALTAAYQSGHDDIVCLLLQHGAASSSSEGVATSYRESIIDVLCSACHKCDCRNVSALIKSGVPVNGVGSNGEVPLCAAIRQKAGTGNADIPATAAAVNEGEGTATQELEARLQIVRALIAAGANVNATGSTPATPLVLASACGYDAVVRELLAGGADVNACADKKDSAIVTASRKGHTAVVELLLSVQADTNSTGMYDDTALVAASREGHVGIVELLLDADADPNTGASGADSALLVAEAVHASLPNRGEIAKVINVLKAHIRRSEGGGPAAPAASARQSSP